ncbi:MAG: hypothetical protein SO533_07445 [Eubacteriales bacterium]|nr:hypothetical protein [Eubacteriales bacterium]
MFYIKATAIDLIDNSSYPEIVLCEFNDIYGIKHRIIEKWPVVSREKFDNIFPKDSYIGCIIVEEKAESVIVNTDQPFYIESTEGKNIFEIHKSSLAADNE